jgi:hypothetical protein
MPLNVRIITGGQGLLELDEPIVPYDFSASKNEEHNITQVVTLEPFVQTVWWKGINQARRGTPTPVADFVRASEGMTVISASKVFIRYISEDLLSLSIQDRERVRILLTASSVGSVPAQLRSMIVPYSRGVVGHMPGNRNDVAHRAAQLFFQKAADEPGWEMLPIEEHKKLFICEDAPQANGALTEQQLLDIFDSHPGYLQLSVDDAYVLVKRSHGSPGGRMFFRGVYRMAKGEKLETSFKEEEVDKALAALQGMSFLSRNGKHSSDEDAALEGVQLFLSALARLSPTASFTAGDVSGWAKNHYKDECPGFLASPNKLTYLIKSNLKVLGLKQVDKAFTRDLQDA